MPQRTRATCSKFAPSLPTTTKARATSSLIPNAARFLPTTRRFRRLRSMSLTLSRPTISLSATSRSKGCCGGSSFFFEGAAATPLDGLGLSGGGLFFAGFSAAGLSGGGGGGRLAFLQRSVHWLGLAKIACVGTNRWHGPVQQNVEALALE